ncbi:hypothetical protein QVD17_20861 [Tagetes erecta]|uniref:Uncharacterized protein n=1 Tax=Tagetes erecta TaxID=13708 RepID=A0AAD8NYG6_TARER|nr:hypothetical protein QVD17_20861 [Tagetes erecta]
MATRSTSSRGSYTEQNEVERRGSGEEVDETAEVWSTSSSADVCRYGLQTADNFLQKKQTAPYFYTNHPIFRTLF